MKTVKSRLIYSVLLLIIGIVFIAVGLLRTGDNVLSTIGFAYVASSIVRFVQYYRIYKDEERRKAYEIAVTEERVAYIANKARSMMFVISIYIAFIASIVFFLIGQTDMGKVLLYLVAVEGLGYMAVLKYYDKKH